LWCDRGRGSERGVLGVRAINTKVLSILPPPITYQVVGYCKGGSGDGRRASSGEGGGRGENCLQQDATSALLLLLACGSGVLPVDLTDEVVEDLLHVDLVLR